MAERLRFRSQTNCHHMKDLLNSRFAAWAALAAAAIVGWFADKGIILGPEVENATRELTTLFNALGAAGLAILAWVAAVIWKRISGGNSGGGNDSGGGSGSGGLWSLLLMAAALGLAGGALSSCSSLGDYDVSGSLLYRFDDGSKAGLNLSPGENPELFGRIPIYDPATGELKGYAEVGVKPKGEVDAAK